MKQLYLAYKQRILSGATTPGQRVPESNGNDGVLHIPRNGSLTIRELNVITRADMQLMYSIDPADWDARILFIMFKILPIEKIFF